MVQHGRSDGLNIRVLNLSFGTDGVQDYRVDPLAHAVEQAWRRGVVVVVAAGNEGYGDARMNAPAYDPYVVAVGASDGRAPSTRADDVVAGCSSRGDAVRGPGPRRTRRLGDEPARPGVAARPVTTRVPGSGTRLFRGSGTSQAAAVVSGAAALLLLAAARR